MLLLDVEFRTRKCRSTIWIAKVILVRVEWIRITCILNTNRALNILMITFCTHEQFGAEFYCTDCSKTNGSYLNEELRNYSVRGKDLHVVQYTILLLFFFTFEFPSHARLFGKHGWKSRVIFFFFKLTTNMIPVLYGSDFCYFSIWYEKQVVRIHSSR